MLELIRCARTMTRLDLLEDDDVGFWMHAKLTFNRRFHKMDTSLHSLALYLHPLCRRLAISQVANGRTYTFMEKTALTLAKQWKWSKQTADLLKADLLAYDKCEGHFAGGRGDALDWWNSLPMKATQHPLKKLALALHSIVPHAAAVEQFFSALGGTQSPKRCRLSVDTFEKLGKVRANLVYRLHKKDLLQGKPIRRKHGHMHTRAEGGIDVELAASLESNFAWVPPMATSENDGADDLPEDLGVGELEHAWDEFEAQQNAAAAADDTMDDVDGAVLEGDIYDFAELDNIDGGIAPVPYREEVTITEDAGEDDWEVQDMVSGTV